MHLYFPLLAILSLILASWNFKGVMSNKVKSVQQFKTVFAIVGLESEIWVSMVVRTWFDFTRYSLLKTFALFYPMWKAVHF